MGNERGCSVTGWQRDDFTRALLKHGGRNVRTVTFRTPWRAFSPTVVVFAAVRTRLALVGQRVPRVDGCVRDPGELKQQHGCEDSQGFVPRRPEAGAAAEGRLGAERQLLRVSGIRSTVVHGGIVSPTGAVSQASAAHGSEYGGALGEGDTATEPAPGDIANDA